MIVPRSEIARRPNASHRNRHHTRSLNPYRTKSMRSVNKVILVGHLAADPEQTETKTGRDTHVLHSFYAMDDGSCVAFFEDPVSPFEFKQQRDYDLHIALEVTHDQLQPMLDKGKQHGLESRGIADHDGIHSIYFRDPNGYVLELTAKAPGHADYMDPSKNKASDRLAAWQRDKVNFPK